jgi:endo-1,4-beta-xylanase
MKPTLPILASFALAALAPQRVAVSSQPPDGVPLAELITAGARQAAPTAGTLGAAARRQGKRFGVSVEARDLDSPRFTRALTQHFTTVTPENALKLGPHGRPGGFDYTDADRIAGFVREAGMGMRLHTLVWEHNDGRISGMNAMSPAECGKALHDHAVRTIGRYADVLDAVDVVNEPLDAQGRVHMPRWTGCLGTDPIGFAFQSAADAIQRAGHPEIQLALNEFDVLQPGPKADGYWLLARNLKDRGVPLTTVGFQAHLKADDRLTVAGVRENLQRFVDAGLKIEITELDVTRGRAKLDDRALANRQSELVAVVLQACAEAGGASCLGATSWGLSDDVHWRVRDVPGSRETPALLDEHKQPKPSYDAALRALQGTVAAR